MSYKIPGALLVALAAGTSNAALISFASDTDPDNPTLVAEFGGFESGPGSTMVADFESTFVELVMDPDDDGPLGNLVLEAKLDVEMTLDYVGSGEVAPGLFAHLFNLVGRFEFTNADFARSNGDPAWSLTGTINAGEAIFAGLGNASIVNSASMTGFDITYDLINVPEFGSPKTLPGDFGFTLTDINNGAGASLVTADGPGQGGAIIGIDDFDAEASFSGSFVPTPGTISIAAISGICIARRRRSA